MVTQEALLAVEFEVMGFEEMKCSSCCSQRELCGTTSGHRSGGGGGIVTKLGV